MRDDDFIFGLCSNRFFLAEAIHAVSRSSLEFRISWQAQYVVRFEGGSCCSAHCKKRFICDADQS